jgi:hypothetical protein
MVESGSRCLSVLHMVYYDLSMSVMFVLALALNQVGPNLGQKTDPGCSEHFIF